MKKKKKRREKMASGRAGAGAAAPEGWGAHVAPEGEWDAADRRAVLLVELAGWVAEGAGWEALAEGARRGGAQGGEGAGPPEKCPIWFDFEALRSICPSADLFAALDMQPAEGLACLAGACYQVLFARDGPGRAPELWGEFAAAEADAGRFLEVPRPRVLVRLFNHPQARTAARDLKAKELGRLVAVQGRVVRVGTPRPLVTAMDFACGKCGLVFTQGFPDGRFTLPSACPGQGCRSRTFAPNKASARCVDWQRVRLQEAAALKGDKRDLGQIPRTVECELTEDLVHCCRSGDSVTVTGIVKALPAEGGAGGSKRGESLFLLYVDAVSLESRTRGVGAALSSAPEAPVPESAEASGAGNGMLDAALVPVDQTLTDRDHEFAQRFAAEYGADTLRQLVYSLCPSIYGHSMEKTGLLLALFGGVRKHAGDPVKAPVRGDVHVLLVGDPGMGKSQMLRAAAAAAPRGLYVCGNTTSAVGLTASVVRDPVTGDHTFEAGAVVLADQGCCCIDEFDKMKAQHHALLQAMEQQEVSVAKAGLVSSLPARTSVLAAANPAGGNYNRGKTVQENLKMSPALTSRFDLVFVMMDRPDQAKDSALTEHVMALHSGAADRAVAARNRLMGYNVSSLPDTAAVGELNSQAPAAEPNGGLQGASLAARLMLRPGEELDEPLPKQLFRKYVAYARQTCHPHLSLEAKRALQDFYLVLRKQARGVDGSAVTARQLEALVRLSEARARVDLRTEVTGADARDAIEVVQSSMVAMGIDEYGMVDFRGAAGGGASKKAEAKRFLGALSRIANVERRATFQIHELYSVADDLELQVEDMTALIDSLNESGELLKKGGGVYQLASARGASARPAGPRSTWQGPRVRN